MGLIFPLLHPHHFLDQTAGTFLSVSELCLRPACRLCTTKLNFHPSYTHNLNWGAFRNSISHHPFVHYIFQVGLVKISAVSYPWHLFRSFYSYLHFSSLIQEVGITMQGICFMFDFEEKFSRKEILVCF